MPPGNEASTSPPPSKSVHHNPPPASRRAPRTFAGRSGQRTDLCKGPRIRACRSLASPSTCPTPPSTRVSSAPNAIAAASGSAVVEDQQGEYRGDENRQEKEPDERSTQPAGRAWPRAKSSAVRSGAWRADDASGCEPPSLRASDPPSSRSGYGLAGARPDPGETSNRQVIAKTRREPGL